jgi:hypothetical protein
MTRAQIKNKNIAYHFVGDKLRDGRPVPRDGVWLKHVGEVKICESGLHASRDPFDALTYAPGSILCKVHVRGIVSEDGDKLVCRERKIIARFDATDLLRASARRSALDVVHLWRATQVVLEFLKTGNPKLRAAVWDAAWGAAWAAERAARAARAAVWAAADDAWAAAWDAAWNAAWDAAWAAADDARAAADAAWAAAVSAQRATFKKMVDAEFRRLGK